MKSKFRNILLCITAASAVCITGTAQAGNGSFTPVNVNGRMFAWSVGALFLTPDAGTYTTIPACATLTRMVIDGNTTQGRVLLNTFLTAYALGKKVSLIGTGDCAFHGGSETVSGVSIIQD